ncbi:MAG: hypothetical protein ACEPOZ_03065 [Marinifilaceae bacterium]
MNEIFTLLNSKSAVSTSKIITMFESFSLEDLFESEAFLSFLDRCQVQAPPHLIKSVMGFVQSHQVLPLTVRELDEFKLN